MVYIRIVETVYHLARKSLQFILRKRQRGCEQGIQGEQGVAGQTGPLLYPAGEFKPGVEYVRDTYSAPYIYYNGKWYFLKTLGHWTGSETNTPDKSADWEEFHQYDAIFAKIGIIGNGLIGNAVFNGIWMFSKRGLDASGNETFDYQKFYNGLTLSESTDYNPYEPTSPFKPAMAINLKKGDIYFNYGKGKLSSDGITYTDTYFDLDGNSAGTRAVNLNEQYLIFKDNTQELILDYDGLKYYSIDGTTKTLVTSIGVNGNITENLIVKNFRRLVHTGKYNTDNLYEILNGSLIIHDNNYILLPELKEGETIDVIVITMIPSRTSHNTYFKTQNGNVKLIITKKVPEDAYADLTNLIGQSNKVTLYGGYDFMIIGYGGIDGNTYYKFITIA